MSYIDEVESSDTNLWQVLYRIDSDRGSDQRWQTWSVFGRHDEHWARTLIARLAENNKDFRFKLKHPRHPVVYRIFSKPKYNIDAEWVLTQDKSVSYFTREAAQNMCKLRSAHNKDFLFTVLEGPQ